MKGVILAAGEGTRMRPLTHRRPKPLVPVVNRPMIEHVIAGAKAAGVDELLVVVGFRAEQIEAALGDGSRLGLRLHYAVQREQNGTGAAALLAEDFLAGEPFFLSFGDIVTPPDNYPPLAEDFCTHHPAATITLNWMDDPYEGAAVYETDGVVDRIIEKPPKGVSTTHWNNAGIFVFGPVIFDAIRATPMSQRGEYELPQAIHTLIAQGETVRAVPLEGFRSDMARPSELLVVDPLLIAAETGDEQGVLIGADARIAPGAQIEGPVALAAGVGLGECIVGPGVCVGEGARVGDGAVIAHSSVFAGADLGESCELVYCIIEEGTCLAAATQAQGTPTEPAILGASGEL
jgi:NDP-sugar pyrophosphorylase family protein